MEMLDNLLEKFEFSFINSEEKLKKLLEKAESIETPKLLIDLDYIEQKVITLKDAFNYADIYYAIKANPIKEIIELLKKYDFNFDAASIYEIDYLLDLGVLPSKISYGNTIKKWKDVKDAYEKGIRLFATDSLSDMENIARYAPGSKIFVRILTTGTGAEWPLSRKFGCHPTTAIEILIKSKELGLKPYGISFHVGSQQLDVGQWDEAIAKAKFIFDAVKEHGIDLELINIGGGTPIRYYTEVPDEYFFAEKIREFIEEDFGDKIPRIIMEPGRSLVGEAGIIVTEIVNIAKKSEYSLESWVFLDIGKFSGLIETIDEAIKYTIVSTKNGEPERVILAGPTCDSMDILYENTLYYLPNNIEIGDKLFILGTGAYTLTYSSVSFNGFPPLEYELF